MIGPVIPVDCPVCEAGPMKVWRRMDNGERWMICPSLLCGHVLRLVPGPTWPRPL